MTEELRRLLERAVPAIPAAVGLEPDRLVAAARRRRSRRRGAAMALSVVAVAAVSVGVTLLPQARPAPVQYAGTEPELGRVPLPVDVTGEPVASRQDDRLGRPLPGPVDLLARTVTVKGTAALLGVRYAKGTTCVTLAFLAPAVNQGFSSTCGTPPVGGATTGPTDVANAFSPGDLALTGQGPGGAPGGIKEPALTYGAAPAGTRSVVLVRPGQPDRVAPATDAGDHYAHRAFFLAPWDLGAGPTTALALAADGRELARHVFPYDSRLAVPDEQTCQTYRQVTRSHLSRALTVGRNYAQQHPETDDAVRLSPPRSKADTTAGVREMYTRTLTTSARMAPEERYEYRLAALVVLEKPECYDDPKLPALVRQFLANSNTSR